MKYIYSIITALVLTFSTFEGNSQTIMWTDTFTTGIAATAAQITTWNNFRAQLLSTHSYTKMTISGTFDATGQVCTDTTIILAYANALRTVTSYTSPLTNGNVWSLCNRYLGEVWLNPPSQCSGANCPTGYIIRPGIGGSNQNWGGVNTATCTGPTQRMTLIFEACVGGAPAAIAAFTQDTICSNDGLIVLPAGTPTGGTYSGTGVSGSNFDPSIAGVGAHYVMYSSTDSCNLVTMDSTMIVVNPIPSIQLNPFSNDTVCVTDPVQTTPAGTPAGGTYSGPGVSGTNFDPSVAGVGTHYVLYTYTDSNSCANSDSAMVVVESCVGINENTSLNKVSIYPNPTNGLFTIELGTHNGAVNYSMSTVEGRMVNSQQGVTSTNVTIDISNESKGIYLLKIEDATSSKTYKIIKE